MKFLNDNVNAIMEDKVSHRQPEREGDGERELRDRFIEIVQKK